VEFKRRTFMKKSIVGLAVLATLTGSTFAENEISDRGGNGMVSGSVGQVSNIIDGLGNIPTREETGLRMSGNLYKVK
jgi:hypothetical protein